MSFPFDCISVFMFFETEIGHVDVILIPGASQPQLMEREPQHYIIKGFLPLYASSGAFVLMEGARQKTTSPGNQRVFLFKASWKVHQTAV